MSLGIIILILCINLSLLHRLSTSEFIWTMNLQDRDSPISQARNNKTNRMISLESQGVYALCHEGGEPSLYPSLVRLPLEFNTSSLGLPNPRDTWTPWSRVRRRVSRMAVWLEHGWMRRGWESQSCQSGEGRVSRGFLALLTHIY